MQNMSLAQMYKQGLDVENLRTEDGRSLVFRNLRDGNLYRIYKSSPRMFTGSWLVAERMFYANNHLKEVRESHMKDFVLVSFR